MWARMQAQMGISGRWAVLVALFVAASCGLAAAAGTGYVDDFSGPTPQGRALDNAMYKVTQKDGALRMVVNKTTKWQSEYLKLPEPLDLSQHPYLSVKMTSTEPCLMHIYLVSAGKSDIVVRRVHAVGGPVTFFYDFSGATKVDLTKVEALMFAVNGAANSWTGAVTLDDLRLGDKAERLASIEGIADRIHYRDSGKQSLLVTGLEKAASLKIAGADKLIRAAAAGPIANGQATVTYECIPGATGSDTVTVTAVGEEGAQPNPVSFKVTIEDNLPPTIDAPKDQTVQAGKPVQLRLTGIGDGNIAVEQEIAFAVKSSDDAVVAAKDVKIERGAGGSPYATLSFTAAKPGAADLTLTLDDQGGGKSTASVPLKVRAVKDWNAAPAAAPVADQMLFLGAGEQKVALTGLTDGDGGKQKLTITAAASNTTLVPAPIAVDYAGGDTATLRFALAGDQPATSTITVTVKDNGGTPDNNGDQSVQIAFALTARVKPALGFVEKFGAAEAGKDRWRGEAGISFAREQADGAPVFKVTAKDKVTYSGLWLALPDLDLSAAPYLTVDVQPSDALQFNAVLYDGASRRNDGAKQVKTLTAGEWQTVTFDFSGADQMNTKNGVALSADWIQKVLFNFHPKFGWPFTGYSGTLSLRNLRIGKDADAPARAIACALGPVADQAVATGSGRQTVTLTGLSDGKKGAPRLKATSTAPEVVANPEIAAAADGKATLTYQAGAAAGTATIEVTAEADGAEPAKAAFAVAVLDADAAKAAAVTVNCAEKKQTVHGFGTFYNDVAAEVYGKELGASAMRIGMIENQVEPVNDNSDPAVLNRAALNHKVFNWQHLRDLKAAGVETFILTSWTPPAWMKTNLSENYQSGGAQGDSDKTDNRLDYNEYEEFAEGMVAAVRMIEEETGIKIAAVCAQNEPVFHEPYGSAILDPRHFCEVVKVIGRRFEVEKLATRQFMPEQVFTQTASMNQYIDALNADADASRYCTIVATHGYDQKGVGKARPDFKAWKDMFARSQKGPAPKELWMTETEPKFSGWQSAMNYGMYLYGSLEYGQIGLWTTWSIDGQLINQGKPNDAFYVCSQYFRHIRPGAVRVASASADPDVAATSYVNDEAHGGKFATVLINQSKEARAVRLTVEGRKAPAKLTVSRTDRVNHAAQLGQVASDAAILLPPQSVTTVTE